MPRFEEPAGIGFIVQQCLAGEGSMSVMAIYRQLFGYLQDMETRYPLGDEVVGFALGDVVAALWPRRSQRLDQPEMSRAAKRHVAIQAWR
jgi:hypothetical protein